MVIKKRYYCLIILLFILVPVLALFFKNKNDIKALENYRCPDCNVVLISVDTLRADHLSSYGYHLNTTPNIDNFFKNGVYFKNNTSASSWTLPATMSIMTGLLPSNHHLTNKLTIDDKNGNVEDMTLKPGIKTIAEILKDNGYKTGGFTGGAGVDHSFGFDRGFDAYFDKNNFGGFSDSINESLKWLKENKDNKTFIFLHGYDVHGQFPVNYDKRFVKNYKGNLTGCIEEQKSLREEGLFNKKISLTKDDVKFLVALYDEKIQRMDENLNRFFEEYSRITNNKKTIFILVSDHGDEFYEHGEIDHGHSLYDELINVPLIIKLPDQNNKIEITKRVSSLDILPTITNILKIYTLDKIDGINLFSNTKNNRQIISETEYRYVVNLRSVKSENGWKLIEDLTNRKNQLFNLIFDKKENNNIYSTVKKYDRQLIDKLNTYFF